MTRTEIEREHRASLRRLRIQAAQERQRQADIGTYGEGSELLKSQRSSANGDARGGIWDIATVVVDQNLQDPNNSLQDDSIDRINPDRIDPRLRLLGYRDKEIILCENGSPINVSILVKEKIEQDFE